MFQKWKGQKPKSPEVSQGAHEMGAPRSAEASAAPAADWGEPASTRAEHGPQGHAEAERLAPASRSVPGGGAPGPHPASRGWAPQSQAEQSKARSAVGAESGGHRPADAVWGAQPREARPAGSPHSGEVGSAMTTPQPMAAHGPGVQPGPRAGASSAQAPDARKGERSESREPKQGGVPEADLYHPSTFATHVVETGGDTGRDAGKQAAGCDDDRSTLEVHRDRVGHILRNIYRHGQLTKRALLALLQCPNPTSAQDFSFRRTLNGMVERKWLVATNTPSPSKQKRDAKKAGKSKDKQKGKSGLPYVYVLTREGIRQLAKYNFDFIVPIDHGYRASDIHVRDTWQHDEIAAFYAAYLISQGIAFVTEHEIRHLVQKRGAKVPDMLIITDGKVVMVEVEWSEKSKYWLGRQARMMAAAKEGGFLLAGRWQIEDAICVTTTARCSPKPDALVRALAPYITQPQSVYVVTFRADHGVVSTSHAEAPVEVAPDLTPADFDVEYISDDWNYIPYIQRLYQLPDTNHYFPVAKWTSGEFAGELMIEHPAGQKSAPTYTSLAYRGRKVLDRIPLGRRYALDETVLESLICITQWGSIAGAGGARVVMHELIERDRLHMGRYLRHFRSWVRSNDDGAAEDDA